MILKGECERTLLFSTVHFRVCFWYGRILLKYYRASVDVHLSVNYVQAFKNLTIMCHKLDQIYGKSTGFALHPVTVIVAELGSNMRTNTKLNP